MDSSLIPNSNNNSFQNSFDSGDKKEAYKIRKLNDDVKTVAPI